MTHISKIALVALLPLTYLCSNCTDKNAQKTNHEPDQSTSISKPIIQDTAYTVAVFESEGLGWGYDILYNGKAIIHQTNIPGVPGVRGFESKEDAEKVANYVSYKISNDIFPPSISLEELDSLIKFKP